MSGDERVDPLLSQTHKRNSEWVPNCHYHYVLLSGFMNVDLDSPSKCLCWRVLEAGEFLRVPSPSNHADKLHRTYAIVVFTWVVNGLES